MPINVTTFGSYVFQKNQLTSVIIPDGVTSIPPHIFALNRITSVVIPGSVTSIGEGAFQSNQLASLVIPNSVASIEAWAFINNQLTSVTFLGARPTLVNPSTGSNGIFANNPIPDGGIRVPIAHLSSYHTSASQFGVTTAKIVGY